MAEPFEGYCVLFSVIFLLLFFVGVRIYKKVGWKVSRYYFLFFAVAPLIPYYQEYDKGYNPVMIGFTTGHGVFILACICAWTLRTFIISDDKEEYNKFIDQKMEELGEPSDKELMKVKATFHYLDGPEIKSAAQRKFLTSEWKKRKRTHVELFDDPFEYLSVRSKRLAGENATDDDEAEDLDVESEQSEEIDFLNEARRERLKGALSLLLNAENTIDQVLDDEKDSMDNAPENSQPSDGYAAAENAVNCLEGAMKDLQAAEKSIDEAINLQ